MVGKQASGAELPALAHTSHPLTDAQGLAVEPSTAQMFHTVTHAFKLYFVLFF